MDAQKSRSHKVALIVTERNFRQLDQILEQSGKSRKYKALTKDGLSVDYDDLEEFIRHISINNTPLKKVDVSTHPYFERPSVEIRLGESYDESDTVEYKLSANETEVPYLEQRLEEWIGEVKPWYSRIATINIIDGCWMSLVAIAVSVVILGGFMFLWAAINGIPISTKPSSSSSDVTFPVVYIILFVGLLWMGLGVFVSIARKWIFPVVTFAVGIGLKKHKQTVIYRRITYAFASVLLASVLLPLLISLTANWLSKGWK